MAERYEREEKKPKQKRVIKTLYTIINNRPIFVCTGPERRLKVLMMLSLIGNVGKRMYEIV